MSLLDFYQNVPSPERTVLIGGIPLFQYLLLLNLGLDPLILREIPSCIGSRVRTFFGFRLICFRCWGISVPRMSQCPFPSGNGGHRGPSHFRTRRGEKRGERRVLPRRRANSGERERVSFFPLEMLGGCLLMCFLVCEVRRKDSNINSGKKSVRNYLAASFQKQELGGKSIEYFLPHQ